jgi:hypothetical protein
LDVSGPSARARAVHLHVIEQELMLPETLRQMKMKMKVEEKVMKMMISSS